MFGKNRYVYTCPDVINYRRNQYRLTIWSTVFSFVLQGAFWSTLAAAARPKQTPVPPVEPTLESQD